jgi:transposase
MIRPDVERWNQSLNDLRALAVDAEHPRTRERFQALYMIGSGQTNATVWAQGIGRNDETVLRWLHTYNEGGPDALTYRRTGGRPRFFSQEQVEQILAVVGTTAPRAQGIEGTGWTIGKIRHWVKTVFQCEVSRNVLLQVLHLGDLSWKKCQKVLGKAKPEQRAAYMEEFQTLFAQLCAQKVRLIYVDEVHMHRDMDRGYTWSAKGERAWRVSDCPSLSERLNWFGAYDFGHGRCLIGENGTCNGDTCLLFLHQLKQWIGPVSCPVVIVWDGASYHRDKRVTALAAQLGFILRPLPGYSPDLNPIEGLWLWMREETTKNYCYPSLQALRQACLAFIQRINAQPTALVDRLWPRFELDPAYEELLVSN